MIKTDLSRCTACGACVQTCPQKCISLQPDINGFVYPQVDTERCINCSKCDSACPIENIENDVCKPKAYAAVTLDKEYLLKATSGGAFGAIADYVLRQNGVVYGCAYSENNKVQHIRAANKTELKQLYGSKYVQSDTANTFCQAKADLDSGILVLYSGTPCQIDGFKRFLRKTYPNLLTVDLVCHGVPSYAFFEKFYLYLEQKHNAKLHNIEFRSKDSKKWSLSGIFSGTYKDTNTQFKKPFYHFDHYYYYYFLKSLIYRESCYSCKYATTNRVADFTVGDLWGAEGLNLPFSVTSGCSLLLANNDKADALLREFDLNIADIALDTAVKYNTQLREPSRKGPDRDMIFQIYREADAAKQQAFFEKRFFKSRMVSKIKYAIPKSVANLLLKARYKIRQRG